LTCPICRCLLEPVEQKHRCPKCCGEFFTVEKKKTIDEGEWSRQQYYKAARDSVSTYRAARKAGYLY
jgi:proteasome lid subunit RPN8/RPN11